jgi:hypothetical protein
MQRLGVFLTRVEVKDKLIFRYKVLAPDFGETEKYVTMIRKALIKNPAASSEVSTQKG